MRRKENIMDLITNIQKYSIHDGDGIRTTVFLKDVHWSVYGVIILRHSALNRRFNTTERNVPDVVHVRKSVEPCDYYGGRQTKAWQEVMYTLWKVWEFLYTGIREIVGQKYPVKALVKELMKDLMFYEQSGGALHFQAVKWWQCQPIIYLKSQKPWRKKKYRLQLIHADMFRMRNLKQFFHMLIHSYMM